MNATMNRMYSPGTSPLFGLAAVAATVMTFGTAVLLPSQVAPVRAPVVAAAAQPAAAPLMAETRIVTLPPIEVVGTRPAKLAHGNRRNMPVVFKNKG
jgi:hypothetical protein